ncbi:MAG TPA: hypothetical protein VFN22_05980 [Gemmatimonadales bacterium]|nr:hypothetical protein [Gemmatimonadales bacterium]
MDVPIPCGRTTLEGTVNAAHLHLALNHLPIFAIAFAIGFLVWGLLRRRQAVLLRSGLVLAVVAAAGAGGAFLTGEPAEDVIENQIGISKDRIHAHEEAADFGLWVTVAAGAMALVVLWRAKGTVEGPAAGATTLALVIAILALAALARTAWLGGEISHPELRPAESAAPGPLGLRGGDAP